MRFLLVDAHSVIFSQPDLRALHRRHAEAAREQLIAQLTGYQDSTGTRVVVVFDGAGKKNTSEQRPGGIQIFFSASKKTADDILERLVAKYANEHDMTVATNDSLVQQTVITFGGTAISVDSLIRDLDRAGEDLARRLRALRKK